MTNISTIKMGEGLFRALWLFTMEPLSDEEYLYNKDGRRLYDKDDFEFMQDTGIGHGPGKLSTLRQNAAA